MKRYGITVEERNRMYDEQKGLCGLCGTHESSFKRGLHIDHDHFTGKVRSLLCYRCNRHLVGQHTLKTAFEIYQYLRKYDHE